jgi:hypothetical protein
VNTWEGNIRTGLRDIGWVGVDWMNLAQDKDQWWVLDKEPLGSMKGREYLIR